MAKSRENLLEEIRVLESQIRKMGSYPSELLEKRDKLYGELFIAILREKYKVEPVNEPTKRRTE